MRLVSLDDFLKSAVPPAMIVDAVLPERSIFLVSGEPYSGKSLLALDMSLAIISGQRFLGWACRMGRVVYLGKDSPRWDYAQQARKLANGRGLTLDDLEGFWFCQTTSAERAFHSDQDRDRLREVLATVRADVLVVDSLRKAHLWEENSSGQMTPVMDRIRDITEDGVAVVVVHHKGKPKEGVEGNYEARGSTVITSEPDVHWLLRKHKSGEMRATVGKGRGGVQDQGVRINLVQEPDLMRLECLAVGDFPEEEQETKKRGRGRPRKSVQRDMTEDEPPGW